ncbi:MAG TPA: geranylgeranylglycerol-phosphate geranylgeranyltransferase [Thermoplasmata archaeon]
MRGAFRLARPLNCAMSAVGVAIGGVVAVGTAAYTSSAPSVALAGGAAASFTAGGNALNDLFDRETDRVNHPERPLVSGDVSVLAAKAFVIAAFLLAGFLASFISPYALAIVGVNAGLMFTYEARWKARGLAGNVVISYLVGSLFLFAGVSVFASDPGPLMRTGILAALASVATFGREVTKDIEDVRGDVDRRTLPQRIGKRRAGIVAGAILAVGVLLSVLPLYLGLLSVGYAVVVIPADGMFIYAALHSAANPSRSARVTKYAMIVALAAFLAGAFA